jgi:hypothetical protein
MRHVLSRHYPDLVEEIGKHQSALRRALLVRLEKKLLPRRSRSCLETLHTFIVVVRS